MRARDHLSACSLPHGAHPGGAGASGPGRAINGAVLLKAKTFDLDSDDDVQQHFHERGWTDGLPVVAPTPARVAAMLDWAGMPADHVIGVEPVKGRALTAEKVAINAVLAGCAPPHFPVVAAGVEGHLPPGAARARRARRRRVAAPPCWW